MRVQTAAQGLFTLLMDYHLGKAKEIFGGDPSISSRYKRKHPKKDHSVTHQVVWSGYDGPMRRVQNGPQGKAAKKHARKLTHTRGYYRVVKAASRLRNIRRGELTV